MICTVENCERKPTCRGMCNVHYQRWYRLGDPLAGDKEVPRGTPSERFWPKVNKDGPIPSHAPELGPCWLWTGAIQRPEKPYGLFRVKSGQPMMLAHRFAHTEAHGPIPKNKQLDHLCREIRCVRPDHLEPVTGEQNRQRGKLGVLREWPEFCGNGHPWAENESRLSTSGKRQCRACKREEMRRRRAAARCP